MKKFRNLKLMLIGLFVMMGMNVWAMPSFSRYEADNGLLYGIQSGSDEVWFVGVLKNVTGEWEWDGNIVIPANVTLKNDAGTGTKSYKVVSMNSLWYKNAVYGGSGEFETQTISGSEVKKLSIAYRLDGNPALTDYDKWYGWEVTVGKVDAGVWTSLEELTIANAHNVPTISFAGAGAFTALKTLDLSGVKNDEQVIIIQNGLVQNTATLETVLLPSEDPVTIGIESFAGLTALKTVTFGTGDLNIGDNAFEGCHGAEQDNPATGNYAAVTFNNFGDNVITIGEEAFKNCLMSTLTIGANVESIGDNAFQDQWGYDKTKKLLTINFNSNKMTEIPAVFTTSGTTKHKVTTIKVKSTSVKSIAAGAFIYCEDLKKLDLSEAPALATIPANTIAAGPFTDLLLKGSALKATKWADLNIDLTNANIKTTLKTLTLPVNMTAIDAPAVATPTVGFFANYTALTTVDMGGVTVIPNYLFDGCSALANVTLNEGTTSFGNYAFQGTAIVGMTLPASLGSIGEGVFQDCVKLASINLAGTGVKSIPDYAFYISGVKGFAQDASGNTIYAKTLDKGTACPRFTSALATVTLNAETSAIGKFAFANNYQLGAITFGSKIEKIDDFAFYGTTIATVDLEASAPTNGDGSAKTWSIGNFAFAADTELATVKLSDAVVGVGVGAFAFGYVSGTTPVYTSGVFGAGKLATISGINKAGMKSIPAYAFDGFIAGGKLDLTGCTGKTSGAYNFTYIGRYAFANNKNLEEIELPANTSAIYLGAFNRNLKVKSINLNKTNVSILNPIFTYQAEAGAEEWSLDALTSIDLEKDEATKLDGEPLAPITTITEYALQFTGLTKVKIPATVTSFGKDADGLKANYTALLSTESPTLLNNGAVFQGCIALTEFEWKNVDENVLTLPENTFRGDIKLAKVWFLTKGNATMPIRDAEVFFMCDMSLLKVYVTPDLYNFTVANGYGNDNREYSYLTTEQNEKPVFNAEAGAASDGYYYATYYNEVNSSWFDASKCEVFSAVVEANKVVLKKANVDADGYYKVGVYDGSNSHYTVCVVRSKDPELMPELYSNVGNKYNSTFSDSELEVSNGSAKGSKIKYVFKLAKVGTNVAFYRVTSGTFAKGKVYIEASAPAARLDIVVEGEGSVTGIENLFSAEEDNAPIYNLQGVQVKTAQKGMFIKNGKKFIVK